MLNDLTFLALWQVLQAVFKYHPMFDDALRQLLLRDQRFHVALQEGQRKTWTEVYTERLSKALGPQLWQRVHFVGRTNSGSDYLRLIAGADVLLHPFPFGGSRTSTDGFQVRVGGTWELAWCTMNGSRCTADVLQVPSQKCHHLRACCIL